MPLYEYECDQCGHRFERIQKFSDPQADTCPKCGGSVRKLFSSPAIQFKGTGWYVTDYAKKDTVSSSSSKDRNSNESKDAKDSKSNAAPGDTKAESKGSTPASGGGSDSAPAKSESKADSKKDSK